MEEVPLGLPSWDRVMRAVEKVKDRLHITTAALEKAGVPYAVCGDFAVAAQVGRVDKSAVRTSAQVEALVRRADLTLVEGALIGAGFVRRLPDPTDKRNLVAFQNQPRGRIFGAVLLMFAGERLLPANPVTNPGVSESDVIEGYRVLSLDALVRVELATRGALHGMRVRDLMDVGLVDASWRARVPAELLGRLQELLDTPEG
jgi:hypothetical protein